jgi:hypothetical protein
VILVGKDVVIQGGQDTHGDTRWSQYSWWNWVARYSRWY